jgi:hypothetical protein
MLVSRKRPIRYYTGITLVLVLWVFIFVMAAWLFLSLYQTDSHTAIGIGFVGTIFFLPITILLISKVYKKNTLRSLN